MNIKPLIPFEPIKANTIPHGQNWIAQVKWDGVRILTYFDNQEVRLFNRRLNERTAQYPELLEIDRFCKVDSVILDGEVIALKEGKPSFHQVMRRDGLRKSTSILQMRNRVPIVYMVFDILYCNGEWVTKQPLEDRIKLLAQVIQPQQDIQLVQSFADSEGLFQAVQTQQLEGIVCKDLTKEYVIDGKDNRWQKLKVYHDLIAVVGGVTLRQGIVNSLLLGLYDEVKHLWYIGHAGTGKLKRDEWRQLTENIKQIQTERMSFYNTPERHKDAVWLQPLLTVKIQYMEWTEGGTLRQPSIQAFVNIDPYECTFGQS